MLIGIDFGGTKVEGLLMHPDGTEVLRYRQPTPRGDYGGSVRVISDIVAHLEAETGFKGDTVGIGIPGSMSPVTGLVRNGNTTWLNGKPFDKDLHSAMGKPVKVANDGNCLALSEALDGAAAGAKFVLAVILGTGIGGGLVIDGKIVGGANGIGAEIGHIPQPLGPDDPGNTDICFCGQPQCLETYLAGPAVMRQYARAAGLSLDQLVPLKEIHSRAQAGEQLAQDVLDLHMDRLGRAFGAFVNIIDPEVFVLGGGVSNMPHIARDLPARAAPHIFAAPDDAVTIKVVRAKHGDSSGVRGAARLHV